MNLAHLLRQRADLWRAADPPPLGRGVIPCGYPALDAHIGGWPRAALSEVLGPGGLALAMPAVATLSQQARWVLLIGTPHIPYAPAFSALGVDLRRLLWVRTQGPEDTLWAMEQGLRSGACTAVLAWVEGAATKTLRRLQLGAEAGDSLGLLFRPAAAAATTSPAALRLRLRPRPDNLELDVLKRRGGWPMGPIQIPNTPQWETAQTLLWVSPLGPSH